jgi:hypothetical protein
MDTILRTSHGLRRGLAAAALVLAAGLAASAAAVGGGFWPAAGPARVVLKGPGAGPVRFTVNLRFAFDGAPSDPSGTGVLRALDGAGQGLLAEIPFAWTTGKGRAFRADVAGPEFAGLLVREIGAATGNAVAVVLEEAPLRGTLSRDGENLRARIRFSGSATPGGGSPAPFRGRIAVR